MTKSTEITHNDRADRSSSYRGKLSDSDMDLDISVNNDKGLARDAHRTIDNRVEEHNRRRR